MFRIITVIAFACLQARGQQPPHIIFLVADDLGWNDVGWHNPNILTPNLDSLAKNGVILNQSYVQAVCTPSRVSFMTGYYPYRVGRQNHVLHPLIPTGVSLQLSFLPEKLREVGYSTHLIGKWHLGYCNLSYTPTRRGFDTFFGFYNGALDYFSYTRSSKQRGPNAKWNEADMDVGFDLRNNTKLAREYNGVYSTTLFASVAKDLLSSHSPNEPLYLFLSFQSVHSPLQVPKAFEDRYSNIKDEKRRKYSGMVTAMDNAVGVVVEALKKNGFWDNSLIVFTTDNGGQTSAGGNNWPLRGGKGTLWEGGTRAVTFVYGSILKKSCYINDNIVCHFAKDYNDGLKVLAYTFPKQQDVYREKILPFRSILGLFHAVDWFPTLLTVAGAQPVSGIDGIDQWTVLSENDTAVRNEIIYNIYDLDIPKAAIRIGDYKLIQGFPGKPTDWIAPAENSDAKSIYCTIKENSTEGLRQIYRLYNLKDDPTEQNNLAQKHPKVVHRLKRRLDKLKTRAVPADDPPSDEKGEPKLWKGSFSYGWCKAK